MPLNSVNTNMGAMVAFASLNATETQLQATEKRISTGYRVADATDDGASYAIAQRVRSDVSALGSVNEQLASGKALVTTAINGLNSVSTQMTSMEKLLVALSSGNTSGDTRTQDAASYSTQLGMLKNFITDANYSSKTLIGSFTGQTGYSNMSIVRNEQGANYTVSKFDASAVYAAMSGLESGTATAVGAALSTTGTFTAKFAAVSSALNTFGNASNYLDAQVTFNNSRVDAMNSGLGALIDADLSKESANLQALQTRQQLGTQALSLANQAPNSLLSLFK